MAEQGTPKIISEFKSQNVDQAKRNKEFEDELFPPIDETLYSAKREISSMEVPQIPKFLKTPNTKFFSQFCIAKKDGRYSYAQLGDVLPTNKLNVLRSTNDLPNDVIQGELGDCYFFSAMCALSEEPNNVKKLVDASARGSDSAFGANVYIHGEPVTVLVDSNFPVANTKKLAFANVNMDSGNIWPIVLEKAWAKCNGSFEDIVPGNSADALEFLSPAPIDSYQHNNENFELFKTIEEAEKKGHIILTDISQTENTNLETLAKMGLITNHGYQVIGTTVLKRKNGNEIQLVKIKNLWGTNEWLGDWSDGSLKWTEEFRKTVGLVNKEDGIFWMSFDDYLQFYTNTHICKAHGNYNYICSKFVHKKDNENPNLYTVAKIQINRSGEGYFTVNMKNSRIYRNLKNKPGYENPFCTVTVFREESNEFVYIGSDSGRQDRLSVECLDMQQGTYFVAVSFPVDTKQIGEMDTSDAKINFRLGLYSNIDGVKIEEASEEDRKYVLDFVFNMLSQLAKDNENKYVFSQEGENNTWRAISFENGRKGFGYVFYRNKSDAYLREKMTISNLHNVAVIPILRNGVFNGGAEQAKTNNANTYTSNDESTKKHRSVRKNKNEQKEEVVDTGNDQIDFESPIVTQTMQELKGTPLESTFEVINQTKSKAEIQINVAPYCDCALYLVKLGDEADFDLDSDISFDYMPNVFLAEQKFPQKKYRLKYNGKPVEVYECITEHNTGVFFTYKNRSNELRLTLTATFNKFDNLYLSLTSSDIADYGAIKIKTFAEKFRDDNDDNRVVLVIEPGQAGFFGLTAVNSFEKFSYNCQCDYHFSLAKSPLGFSEIADDKNEQNA